MPDEAASAGLVMAGLRTLPFQADTALRGRHIDAPAGTLAGTLERGAGDRAARIPLISDPINRNSKSAAHSR
ncbi:hypothetical protein KUL25_20075 [Rhodobacteraceae bacterium N5(2021)]|uniref:Uncharacterized protein n=1 Tax=Gymnodinialimonas phycosphaerae TaxID=2841589 RepID=A0A975TUN3_9RHOB|nr:hypothetical protein [Gymnodinialimonas phycosphaerae]MBY4895064.1 hypothetical protein [Gymnodinialimonas phycosphaerae]